MRSESRDAQGSAAALASASTAASPTAQLLARATAGAIEYEDDGRVSVLFPPPGSAFAAPGAMIARAESAPAPAPAASAPPVPGAPPAGPADAPQGAPGAGPGAAAPLDRDDLYADFMRRLRRDVREQREQLGAL
jgi:hypothetical protein